MRKEVQNLMAEIEKQFAPVMVVANYAIATAYWWFAFRVLKIRAIQNSATANHCNSIGLMVGMLARLVMASDWGGMYAEVGGKRYLVSVTETHHPAAGGGE